MDALLNLVILCCLLFWENVFAVPTKPHESGGQEHIVIIDTSQTTSPQVAEVLDRLSLTESHSDVRHVYNNSAFRGFAASMKSHCLDLLANMTDVSVVEKAATVASAAFEAPASLAFQVRPNAPWGLQRISTAGKMQGDPEKLDFDYAFANPDLGSGVDIYILDTGIYTDHNIFNGRASMAWSYDAQNMTDYDGHGTHVSGTAAGAILGVASNANLFGVKTLDANGGGWSSNVIAGIDFVIQSHDARKTKNPDDFRGSVISMSLSAGLKVDAMDTAVRAAVEAGIHVCVAAGNDDIDACGSSPSASGGSAGPAIAVGSVDIASQRSKFSNHGTCVDVYAPGEGVISSWIGGRNYINSLSGTSMATPHVTGMVAYAMGNRTLANDPALMKEWIRMMALTTEEGIPVANNGVQSQTDQGASSKERRDRLQFVNARAARPVRRSRQT